MKCTNNLRQFGIGLHNYHDVHNAFPHNKWGDDLATCDCGSGVWCRAERNYGVISFIVALYPFMEQQQRWDMVVNTSQYRQAVIWGDPESVFTAPYDTGRDYQTRGYPGAYEPVECYRGPIDYLVCPSDGKGKEICPNWRDATDEAHGFTQGAKTNYVGSIGDTIFASGENDYTARGFFSNHSARGNGMRFRNMAELADGTTNTLVMSEIVTGSQASDPHIKGGYVQLAIDNFSPANCMATPDPNDRRVYADATNVGGESRGIHHALGNNRICTFQTILPPNSPSCAVTIDHSGQNQGLCSATSNHPGGVNCLRGDASVSFVSDSVDCMTNASELSVLGTGETAFTTLYYTSTAEPTGKSPYGIWGAMGSIAGGETKSL